MSCETIIRSICAWTRRGARPGLRGGLLLAALAALILNFAPRAFAAGQPFVPLTADEVLNSSKNVFAHYVFAPLQTQQNDYWPNSTCMYYIIPSNTPKSAGNQRLCPSPSPASDSASSYIIDNLKAEIVRMIARGINGVAINLFSTCDWSQSGSNCPGNPGSGGRAGYPGALVNMLRAAAAVDKRFKVLPMPDMTAGIKPTDLPNLWTAPIDGTTIYKHPNIYRWADSNNYPQLSPFCTECFPASQYSTALSVMKANGTPVSWGPVFGSGGCNGQVNGCIFSPYASLPTVTINGLHDVSTDRTSAARVLANVGGVSKGKTYGGGTPINWTGPVKLFGGMGPQAYQSASGTVYEAHNSEAYRAAWESQIALGSALGDVMIFTWNDYGEGTAIEPSQNQYNHPSRGFYDLTGYYTTWLRKGAPPEIIEDSIVYFYRRQTYQAAHDATIPGLSTRPTIPSWNLPAYDEIELVAFVKDAADVVIYDGKKATVLKAKKGMNVLRVPLVAGSPQFFVYRNSVKLIDIKGWPTYGPGQIPAGSVSGLTMCSNCFPAGIPDPLYYSGSTFAWSEGVGLGGSDMSSAVLDPATPVACESKCWNDSKCKSWQFKGSVCTLKSASPRESLVKDVDSGHKLRY